MCRNIKTLRRAEGGPTEEELHLAALQFVRKVSGYRTPSQVNQPAFDNAVREISAATGRLLENLTITRRPPGTSSSTPGPRPRSYTRPSVRKANPS